MSFIEDTVRLDLPDDWDAFSVTEEPLATAGTLLAVSGELDIATAPQLRERLTAAIGRGTTRIVLDLCGVVFMDSVAMAAILHARAQIGDAGRIAVVLDADSYTRIVFEIAGLPRCLELFETREEAVAHVMS